MNESLEELASLYVLDRLEPRERTAFEARLLLDPELAAFVRELEDTLAQPLRTRPPHAPRADLLQRIERQIDALSPALHPASPAPRLATFPWRLALGGLAAVVALGIGGFALQRFRPAPQPVFVFVELDSQQSRVSALSTRATAADPDARFIQLASLAEEMLRRPAGSSAARDDAAYALFDPRSQQGFLGVKQLPPLPADRQYHLWVIDTASGRVRDAGVLPGSGGAGGLYSFSLTQAEELKSGGLNFFVTVEDRRTPPAQPSADVVLGRSRI